MPKARRPMPTDTAGLLHMMDKALIDTAIPKAPGELTRRYRRRIKVPVGEASLEALSVHRKGTQWGGHRRRVCQKRDCTQPAVSDMDHCRHHLTMDEKNRFTARPKDSKRYVKSRPAAARRVVQEMIARDRLPVELLMDPTFKKVWNSRKSGPTEKGEVYAANMTWTQHCNLLAFEMVRAWLHRLEHDDIVPWVECIRRGRELGILV